MEKRKGILLDPGETQIGSLFSRMMRANDSCERYFGFLIELGLWHD